MSNFTMIKEKPAMVNPEKLTVVHFVCHPLARDRYGPPSSLGMLSYCGYALRNCRHKGLSFSTLPST